MKIRYLNGARLYRAVLAGGNTIFKHQDGLNKLNVFPVPDSDTGTNLVATMRCIFEESRVHSSFKDTLVSIADSALLGARGNSGIMFAQFLYGFSNEVATDTHITPLSFSQAARKAVDYMYSSVLKPVEGTILTVIREWADAITEQSKRHDDFFHLFVEGIAHARKSLSETPQKLKVLADAGVVDAGGQGFVHFLDGIRNLILQGFSVAPSSARFLQEEPKLIVPVHDADLSQRYCSETLLSNCSVDINQLKATAGNFGNSVVVAGSSEKVRLHVHTNNPSDLFFTLKDYGTIRQIKVNDMVKQHEAAYNRKYPIALVTDSGCDLPQSVIDKYQIHIIHFPLNFGDTMFLDRITITPDQFYQLLKTHPIHPKTSQPSTRDLQNTFSFLATHYEQILVIHISEKLSGTFNGSVQAIKKIKDKKTHVVNSKKLSAGMGLLVLRVAQEIEVGTPFDEVVRKAEEWVSNSYILADIITLKYLIRGGRISKAKGFLANTLKLKPLVSVDDEGKASIFGKSISREGNMKKILKFVEEKTREKKVWNYAIVHSENRPRADLYAQKLSSQLGMDPLYIEDLSPVIGAHNGPGCVGLGLMME